MGMTVEPDSAGVRFPPPFVYLGALLLGLAAERFFTLRSFGIDLRLLAATGALLFIAGGATMLPLVLIVIQTQVIAREERYLEAKFGDDYRRYKAQVRRWL
jgi:protein-S-isoprenylcysteine O-methyltransferase Ste14